MIKSFENADISNDDVSRSCDDFAKQKHAFKLKRAKHFLEMFEFVIYSIIFTSNYIYVFDNGISIVSEVN